MRDVHGEQTVRNMKQNCKVYNLNEIVKRPLQCNSFWIETVDILKVCQARSKPGNSVASSMGYFIDIMLIRAVTDLIYFTVHTSLLLNPSQDCYEKWIVL